MKVLLSPKSNLFYILLFLALATYSQPPSVPNIYPVPKKLELGTGYFHFDSSSQLIFPNQNYNTDSFASQLLINALADDYNYVLEKKEVTSFPSNTKMVLVGSLTNPLIREYCLQNKLTEKLISLGEEGYILHVTNNNIVIASNSRIGSIYGVQTFRQIISQEQNEIIIPNLTIEDSPTYSFRGIKVYLPGKDDIPFFKRFIKEFLVFYKFNKIILELNANMRFDRHPELNIGTREFSKHLDYMRLNRPPGPNKEYQDSSHQDNANGEIYEKEELAQLKTYIEQYGIEVVPEIPSLTHSYYLLSNHEELAENPKQSFPDTYCPLKPEVYKLYFDVLEEYIQVFNPKIIHIGHDEWRMEKDVCPLCAGKDYGKLFGNDLVKIYEFLKSKNIRTAIWGDHLLESVRGTDNRVWETSTGYTYKIPGAMTFNQVEKTVPKDILIFNWFWDDINNDRQLSEFGFEQVYGNLRPEIEQWEDRNLIKGVLGGAPSSWAGSTEMNFGKDQVFDFLGSSSLLWTGKSMPSEELALKTSSQIKRINSFFNGQFPPSNFSEKCSPIDLSAYYTDSFNRSFPEISANIKNGTVTKDDLVFNLPGSKNDRKNVIFVGTKLKTVKSSIPIGSDANSIIFLHAAAKSDRNEKAYGTIFNFPDTSELLGWYEIVYEDNYVETIPIRYGINILDWSWKKRIGEGQKSSIEYNQDYYAYGAFPIDVNSSDSNPITFFSFEWKNMRFGKKIREISLKSSKDGDNEIILLALSSTTGSDVQPGKDTTSPN